MKQIFLVVSLFVVAIYGVEAQKQISCKSGQDIVVDGASNFISSNLQQLMDERSDWRPEDLASYKEMLMAEQRNRLELAKLERLLAILEYDAQRADSKEDKNNVKAKQQTAKKDMVQCDREYEKLSGKIQQLIKDAEKNKNKAEEVMEVTPAKAPMEEAVAAPDSTKEVVVSETPKEKMVINKIYEEKGKKKEEDCGVAFSGRDEVSKKKRKSLHPRQLLTYTPEKMKNYFKLKDFLTISIAGDKHNGKYTFNVEARFSSKDVMRSYGVIHKTDFVRLQFVNGKKVFLKILEVKDPYLDKQSGETLYQLSCALSNDQDFSMLENGWLDSFGVMWSTGFEEYTVYDVDFFQRLIGCINHD